jgi:hypothetical protein
MANQPALEIATAPRDAAGYDNIPPFQLRLLVTKLGGFSSPERTAAWHQLNGNKPAQVDHVLALLKDWDSSHTNGVNGTAHVAPVSPAMVAAVSPGATAAAAAAAAPSAAGVKRVPKVTTPAVTPTAAGAPSNVDVGAAVIQELADLKKGLVELGILVQNTVGPIAQAAKTNEQSTSALIGQIKEMQKLQSWTLTALLTIAENQIGAAPLDMLRSAVADSEALGQLVEQVKAELGK